MWGRGCLRVKHCHTTPRPTTPHHTRVAFFDATNTTQARRQKLLERNRRESKAVSLIFVESVCDDPNVLQRNYQLKLQNNGGRWGRGWGVL